MFTRMNSGYVTLVSRLLCKNNPLQLGKIGSKEKAPRSAKKMSDGSDSNDDQEFNQTAGSMDLGSYAEMDLMDMDLQEDAGRRSDSSLAFGGGNLDETKALFNATLMKLDHLETAEEKEKGEPNDITTSESPDFSASRNRRQSLNATAGFSDAEFFGADEEEEADVNEESILSATSALLSRTFDGKEALTATKVSLPGALKTLGLDGEDGTGEGVSNGATDDHGSGKLSTGSPWTSQLDVEDE